MANNNFRHSAVGLGGESIQVAVYIANLPPLPEFTNYDGYRALRVNEINTIAELTGNHWRKIFNVFAKLAFQLNQENFNRWQDLRDQSLLQEHSPYGLLFSAPDFSNQSIHIVTGKTYAKTLGLLDDVIWLDESFAVNRAQRLIVAPYFDYRQLSNQKLLKLVDIIKSLSRDG